MELEIEKKPPMEPVSLRIPPRIRKQAQAIAEAQAVKEREVYRAIIENFFNGLHPNNMLNCIPTNDSPLASPN